MFRPFEKGYLMQINRSILVFGTYRK